MGCTSPSQVGELQVRILYVGRLRSTNGRSTHSPEKLLFTPQHQASLWIVVLSKRLNQMLGSQTRSAQQAPSAEAAPSEPDSILEMLQANNRATCLSPLPLLHWLYVTYVVDEKYEPHYPQTTMGSRQPGSIAQHNA